MSISCDLIAEFDIAFSLCREDSKLISVDSYYSGIGEKLVKYPLGRTVIYNIWVGNPDAIQKISNTNTDLFGAYSLEITMYKRHAITGKITDSQTGDALSSARIIVEHNDSYTAETDAEGMFEIFLEGARSCEPFSIQVQKTGYSAKIIEGIVSENTVTDPIQAQTYIRKNYSCTPDDTINEYNTSLVVFIHEDIKAGFGPVQQAEKCAIVKRTATQVQADE